MFQRHGTWRCRRISPGVVNGKCYVVAELTIRTDPSRIDIHALWWVNSTFHTSAPIALNGNAENSEADPQSHRNEEPRVALYPR